ncbi:MAG: hypothetical protein FWC19_02850 [Treponema sp.]|nr:hypothetical protein [Treponema sp.]MCL2271728.1 hypothetical protein [Treponema sp.]
MKKILVVLLILAVAGGVFAQGNWSLSGLVELGATMDFNNAGQFEGDRPGFNAKDFAKWGDDGGVNRAQLGLSYGRDGFSAGLKFSTFNQIIGDIAYYGDNYSLGAQGHLFNAFLYNWSGGVGNELQAWGNYSMLNGMVDLLVGVNKWISDPWSSDLSFGIFRGDKFISGNKYNRWGSFDLQGDSGSPGSYPIKEQSHIWANLCCRSGIMANFNFSGISFGAMLRSTPENWGGGVPFFWDSKSDKEGDNSHNELDLIEGVLSTLILGMKFDFYPIQVAAQFNVEKFGAYVGLNWTFTDAISAGLSFLGTFKELDTNDIQDTLAVFGASLNYSADVFGVALKAGYYFDANIQETSETGNGGIVGIAPSVWFNVIPSHLQVNVASDFMFGDEGFGWRFVPGILWNFKGTGAGDWSTGIGLHYALFKPYGAQLDSDNYNEANITFRWNF